MIGFEDVGIDDERIQLAIADGVSIDRLITWIGVKYNLEPLLLTNPLRSLRGRFAGRVLRSVSIDGMELAMAEAAAEVV